MYCETVWLIILLLPRLIKVNLFFLLLFLLHAGNTISQNKGTISSEWRISVKDSCHNRGRDMGVGGGGCEDKVSIAEWSKVLALGTTWLGDHHLQSFALRFLCPERCCLFKKKKKKKRPLFETINQGAPLHFVLTLQKSPLDEIINRGPFAFCADSTKKSFGWYYKSRASYILCYEKVLLMRL